MTARPWGKLEFDDHGLVVASQSLADHSRDVAAVFDRLVRLPGYSLRLARLAGRKLDEVTICRLSHLAFLHDCGKVNSGFQARLDRSAPMVGHIKPLVAIFGRHPAPVLFERGCAAVDATELMKWGPGVGPLLDAIFSHHGKPWPADEPGVSQARLWQPDGMWDPIEGLAGLRKNGESQFPAARSSGAPALPESAEFVHAVAGLVQLADWIASSDWRRPQNGEGRVDWATQRLRDIGLDPVPWREFLVDGSTSFRSVFGKEPYPAQLEAASAPGRLVLLEAETGSGKTEAALWRFARLFRAGEVDGLYFALPTRTAAAQIHERVRRFVRGMWSNDPPAVVLAVPGYLDDRSADGLPPAADRLDRVDGDAREATPWAAEHPKRYFASLMGVGTIDQALLAAMRVKHAHLRGSALMRLLLVVDEVHASDAYMRRLLVQLLRDHVRAGGHALLLSATLGGEARDAIFDMASGVRWGDLPSISLTDALARPYPLLSSGSTPTASVALAPIGREKVVRMELVPSLDDPEAIACLALHAATAGGKVLVVRNSVRGAVAVQRALEQLAGADHAVLLRLNGRATLHHGRYAREDRRRLDEAVMHALGGDRSAGGAVIVGTQTLEQSLDLDADLLITDLCPIDVLLQRIGRLHRRERPAGDGAAERPRQFGEPRAVVLTPGDGLESFLRPRRGGGRLRHGLGHVDFAGAIRGVYADLTVIEATRRLIDRIPKWRIPRMNRYLVEGALHSEAIEDVIESFPADERERWQSHRSRVEGDGMARNQLALDGALRREEDFMGQPVLDEVALATRLGSADWLVDLPPGTTGPFGFEVRRIAVPVWMVPEAEVADAPRIRTGDHESGLRLEWPSASLIYDRFGLREGEESA